MKNILRVLVVSIAFFTASGFGAHKFYVAIFQVHHAPEKKMLQITTRLFIDDLNDALELKYKVKGRFGEPDQSAKDEELMKRYFDANFIVLVNGKPSALEYKSSEIDNNVLVCYFALQGISRIKSLEIRNKILTDLVTEQQNIIQTSVNGQKKSYLLTAGNDRVKLAY